MNTEGGAATRNELQRRGSFAALSESTSYERAIGSRSWTRERPFAPGWAERARDKRQIDRTRAPWLLVEQTTRAASAKGTSASAGRFQEGKPVLVDAQQVLDLPRVQASE